MVKFSRRKKPRRSNNTVVEYLSPFTIFDGKIGDNVAEIFTQVSSRCPGLERSGAESGVVTAGFMLTDAIGIQNDFFWMLNGRA